jgi:hypothetical protein
MLYKKIFDITGLFYLLFLLSAICCKSGISYDSGTVVDIQGDKFLINGKPTYEGRAWNGFKIEGLLMNSRMVQGIFDDQNPETAVLWKYPDTGEWSADRNTDEFVAAMEEWYAHGLLSFSINLQGGSPVGYGNQKPWQNSAFDANGVPREAYFERLERILKKSDELGMIPILGIFYFGQDQFLEGDAAIYAAVDFTIDWLFDRDYRNVLIEVNNECNVNDWDHEILKDPHVHKLISHVRSKDRNGYRFFVGTSYGGGSIPSPEVVDVSDFILIHGNGVSEPERITEMIQQVRALPTYTTKPILFNEDDHYDFDKPTNNMLSALQGYASWGFFDYRRDGEEFNEGYQSVPVDWGINSDRKQGFFNLLKEITGGNQ